MQGKPDILLLCGPSHSGKSSFASECPKEFVIISSDAIRMKLFHSHALRPGDDEALVWAEFDRQKNEALRKNKDIVLDACHLSIASRWNSMQNVNSSHTKRLVVFIIPLTIIIDRIEETKRISIKTATNIFKAFKPPTLFEINRLGFETVTIKESE